MPKLKKVSLNNIISTHRIPLLISVVFVFFLLALPNILNLAVPCLRPASGQSYTDAACNLDLVFNWYLALALIVFGVAVIAMYVSNRKIGLKILLTLASFLALLVIVSFHLYIPQAEAKIHQAPIYLNSLNKLIK